MKEDVMAQLPTARTHVGTWIVITIVLVAALIGTLWVPFYNHLTPALGGFPFFYWYQLLWVPIVAILSAIAYALTKWTQRNNTAPGAADRAPAPDKGPGEAT
jgi:magnesium-transporting ATPase (P-type)